MDNALRPGAITSSSDLPLQELVARVSQLNGSAFDFDLLLLRGVDIQEIFGDGSLLPSTMAGIVADNFVAIQTWTQKWLKDDPHGSRIAALATYFPAISGYCDDSRDRAIQALVHSVKLMVSLQSQYSDRVPYPIVEIVAGSRLDPCMPGTQGSDEIHEFSVDDKLAQLCESLCAVVDKVQQPFGIAIEMEPGESYIVNGIEPMQKLVRLVDERFPTLKPYLGFNLDIAHMRIANVDAADLDGVDGDPSKPDLVPYIMHAHISDHPGMHTHDQAVGTWTNVDSKTEGYQPFMQRLVRRAVEWENGGRDLYRQGKGLPFSGVIALELEGCDHIFDVHDSITRIRHLIDIAQVNYAESLQGTQQPS